MRRVWYSGKCEAEKSAPLDLAVSAADCVFHCLSTIHESNGQKEAAIRRTGMDGLSAPDTYHQADRARHKYGYPLRRCGNQWGAHRLFARARRSSGCSDRSPWTVDGVHACEHCAAAIRNRHSFDSSEARDRGAASRTCLVEIQVCP